MSTDYYKERRTDLVLPNVFLIGAQKCGTTSMAYWLDQHPEFCVSRPKESRFLGTRIEEGLDVYSDKYFSHHKGEKYIVEASPQCLSLPFVSERIKQFETNPKIIVTVRDPVERAYSAWAHFQRMRPGRETRSFAKAIKENLSQVNWHLFESEEEYIRQADHKGGPYRTTYVEFGLYMNQIRKYIASFGEDSISIHILEDMIINKRNVFGDVIYFIGATNDFSMINFEPKNIAPTSTEDVDVYRDYPYEAQMLKECFYGDVVSLCEFMKRDLINLWWGE